MADSSSSGAIASSGGGAAAGQHTGHNQIGAIAPKAVRRPTAMTRNGIRQFVETEHGLRLFLQCVSPA